MRGAGCTGSITIQVFRWEASNLDFLLEKRRTQRVCCPHILKPMCLHSNQCLCNRQASPRRQPAGRSAAGRRCLSLARRRLSGLRSPLHLHACLRILHHARQEECAVLPSRVAPRRRIEGSAARSNHSNDNLHLMIESVTPDAKPDRSSHPPDPVDGADR